MRYAWVSTCCALARAGVAVGLLAACGGSRVFDEGTNAGGGPRDETTAASGSGGSGSSASATGGLGGGGGVGAGDTTSGSGAGGSLDEGVGGSGGTPAPLPSCNGYEPCDDFPAQPPEGYTLRDYLSVSNGTTFTTCRDFADCDMWRTHYGKNYVVDGAPSETYYNRLGSPFPTAYSRYLFIVPPKKVTYAKFHVLAPGEVYRYSDSTPVMNIERATGATTCYRRGPGSLVRGRIYDMGGTGIVGLVKWNISVLPGDMGNSGNTSICQGDPSQPQLWITADPAVAKASVTAAGNPFVCLLREGKDYYINFMSTGDTCVSKDCTIGGIDFRPSETTEPGAMFTEEISCP